MKKCTEHSGQSARHPLGMTLLCVVGGSAALTFTLAAVSPDHASPRHGAAHGLGERATPQRTAQADPQVLHRQVNELLQLEDSQLQQIDVHPDQPLEGELAVVIDGEPMTLTYWPHSVRAEGFRVWEQVDDGSLVEFDAGPARTIRGMLNEMPGATVAGSILDDGLHASFGMPDGRLLWIEPVASRVAGADPSLHVLYDSEDADCEDGVCASPQHWFTDLQANMGDGDGGMMFSQDCELAEIAFDADFSFFQLLSSNTNNVINYINNIINAINNNQYEDQVGIRHEITEIVVRTSSAANPYSSCNSGTLLNQFRNVWRTAPESSIPRDMAHLMTGCNMGGTLGVAWLGTVCDSIHGNHYGLSRRMTSWSCQTDLVAHETGHNWGAGHCSCSSSTMNASITCANTFTGAGSNSVNQILSFKNSVNCLGPCIEPDPPANNECGSRIPIGEGSTAFDTEHATTEGPDEPSECTFFGNPQIQNDVWFEHVATCTGELTVSVCGSSFNTKLGVYEGGCPTQPDTVDACDTTSCPDNRSLVTLPVVQGETYVIRVGGRTDQTGEGTIDITCEEVTEPDCPGDLNDDGVVDGADLLIMLGDWGPCPGCDGDLNDDDVVDGADLLILLGGWGACPE